MNNYTVYFELYGKKLKTTVTAYDAEHAKTIVKGKIKFHKVEKQFAGDDIMDFLNGFKKH